MQNATILKQLDEKIDEMKRDTILYQAEKLEQSIKPHNRLLKTPYDAY
jgi:hypothetical protein